jgi:c-di-GMP-binding flagellar brake protein YcgR
MIGIETQTHTPKMSNHEQAPKKAKFADMHFQVGQRVQLILEGPSEHKQYTSVIGWVENEFLMLRVPQEDGWIVHLREGMNVQVRLFSGLSIFTFKSRINTLLLNPRNYMLMSFPDEILETPMRSHLRVRASLPVEIVSSALTGHNLGDFHLHDISGGGTSVVGPYKLGEVDSQVKLRLRFDLQSTGKSEDAEMTGTIQNVELVHHANQADSTPEYQHGIRFHEPDARLVLLVHELQQLKH